MSDLSEKLLERVDVLIRIQALQAVSHLGTRNNYGFGEVIGLGAA